MSRFLLGILVGGLGVIAIQVLFSPERAAPVEESTTPASIATVGNDWDAVSPNPARSPDQGIAADNMQSTAPRAPAAAGESGRSASLINFQGRGPQRDERSTDQGSTDEAGADTVAEPANPIRLPDTHEGFVSKKPPALPDAHAELEREAYDEAWASVVEGLMVNHITTHPQGGTIGIISLQCRTTRCEIAGTAFGENGAETWKTVRSDMQGTAWYAAYLTPSTLESGGGFPGEYRFVSIFARIGNDIPPPVEP